jgi:hypothetical protein
VECLNLVFGEVLEAEGGDLHLTCGEDNRLKVVDRHQTFGADGEALHLTCCEDHAWRVKTSIKSVMRTRAEGKELLRTN